MWPQKANFFLRLLLSEWLRSVSRAVATPSRCTSATAAADLPLRETGDFLYDDGGCVIGYSG